MPHTTIRLRDCAGLDNPRPVTGGIPLAEGAAPAGTAFRLTDASGGDLPLQTQALATWPDGSTRWLLLDAIAAAPCAGETVASLGWGDGVPAPEPGTPVRALGTDTLASGPLTIGPREGCLLAIGERLDVGLRVLDAEGRECSAIAEAVTVECAGPVRGTLTVRAAVRRPDGSRWFSARLRASIYAGATLVRLEPLIIVDADSGILQHLQDLSLIVAPRSGVRQAALGGEPGWRGVPRGGATLHQVDDRAYVLSGAASGGGGRAPGWAEVTDAQGTVAVALREMWQQWPKALRVSETALEVGLFPRFAAGAYAHMEPWYKYQYLFEGPRYRLRTGQARRWEIWLDLAGDGDALARHANAPLVPAAEPAEAIATGVWDDIVPAGGAVPEYDRWAENLFAAYTRAIEAQRDYGAMNWGDWFGERQVNWGNHEYDTVNQVLIQYARTADPRYLYTAEAAARHSAEVDTIHAMNADLAAYFQEHWPNPAYPCRAGMVHEHAVGHVGCFYPIATVRDLFVEHGIVAADAPHPYLCLDPYNLGHVWTQGLVRQYFLTGDPFLKETVDLIADNLALLVEDRQYRFMGHTHCGRVTGWPLMALGGAYELGNDERFLRAMRTLTEDALRDQDPVCGGWLIHPMAPDHCTCQTARHTGMAGFITAILIDGISRYYQLSGDERLPSAIQRAVTFLDNDTWREGLRDWRYTSCPASNPRTGQPGVVIMAHVNSVRYTGDAEHLRVLRMAWEAKFERLLQAFEPGPGVGKTYSYMMYGCAEAIGLLTRLAEAGDRGTSAGAP